MKKILLTSIIALGLSHLGFAYGQGKPRFQDPAANFDFRNEFFSLNSNIGFFVVKCIKRKISTLLCCVKKKYPPKFFTFVGWYYIM